MPSQFGEEPILYKLLPEETGVYVDIGAGHPWWISNTSEFYKKGWTGLLIEPLPNMCSLLKKERSKDTVVECACSSTNGTMKLYVKGEFGGMSSLDRNWTNDMPDAILQVKVNTIDGILTIYPEIRDKCKLCNIDVEGHELEVINGIDLSKFNPKVFVIRSISNKRTYMHQKWEPKLLSVGYMFHKIVGDNRIYIKNSSQSI